MSMKSFNSPRRTYNSKGTTVLCLGGNFYAPKFDPKTGEFAETTFREGVPVTVEELNEDLDTITVKQRKPHAKVITETWHLMPKTSLSPRSWGRAGCVNPRPSR